MPLIYRTEDKSLIQRMSNILRRYLPRSFFNYTKRILGNHKSGKIALGFASTTLNNKIVEDPGIPTYIKNLFEAPQNESPLPIPSVSQEDHSAIVAGELEAARQRLSRGKASGSDQLLDHWLKNDKIW